MNVDTVAAILEQISACWPTANDIEITLEANPTSVEAGKFSGFRDAGINRISMGIQALRNQDLTRLGRLHSVEEAQTAFDLARNLFDRVSFDLIYARQDQSLQDWRLELEEALAMAADHLSLYQLTIEPGTAFGDRYAIGRLPGLPDDDLGADLYDLTQDMCGAAGLPAYEVSNHASDMAQSRHNLVYWRYGDYAGIGPGAHGRLTLGGVRYALDTPLSPLGWLQAVETKGSGEKSRQALDGSMQAAEYAMMSLRLSEGMDMRRYQGLAGNSPPRGKLEQLEQLGFTETDGRILRVTPKGRPVLNAILGELLA